MKYQGKTIKYSLAKFKRLSSGVPPVQRFGMILGKDWDVKRRCNTHFALCYREGAEINLEFGSPTHLERVNYPHLSITFPGQPLLVRLHSPCDEIFFTYDTETARKLFGGRSPDYTKRVIPLDECPGVRAYWREIKRLLAVPPTPEVCTQLDLLAAALLSASFWSGNRIETEADDNDARIFRIEHLLSQCYHDKKLNLSDLAKKCGMSLSTLRRTWQKSRALSLYQWIMELRNREACELLETTELSVKRISEALGFSSQLYFSTFFRARNGCSPLEYRKKNWTNDH